MNASIEPSAIGSFAGPTHCSQVPSPRYPRKYDQSARCAVGVTANSARQSTPNATSSSPGSVSRVNDATPVMRPSSRTTTVRPVSSSDAGSRREIQRSSVTGSTGPFEVEIHSRNAACIPPTSRDTSASSTLGSVSSPGGSASSGTRCRMNTPAIS